MEVSVKAEVNTLAMKCPNCDMTIVIDYQVGNTKLQSNSVVRCYHCGKFMKIAEITW